MAPRTTWLLALLVALASGCTTLAQYHAGDAAAAPEDSELLDGRTDDAGVRADVAPADATCSSQRLLITQGANIGEIDGFEWHPDGEVMGMPLAGALYFGHWLGGGPDPTWLFLRFTLADDIRRASPLQARLKIWGVASSNWSSDRHALLVLVEDSANAPVTTDPSHSPDKPSGVKTLQELRWPASGGLGWKTDDYNEVDVSALIFALANAYDLRAGAHVQLWIRGDFSTESAEVATLPPSDGSYRSPVLEIDHCAP